MLFRKVLWKQWEKLLLLNGSEEVLFLIIFFWMWDSKYIELVKLYASQGGTSSLTNISLEFSPRSMFTIKYKEFINLPITKFCFFYMYIYVYSIFVITQINIHKSIRKFNDCTTTKKKLFFTQSNKNWVSILSE